LRPKNIEEYPKIIFAVKYYFSRDINFAKKDVSESKQKKGEKGIWQRRYYEHTIIDDDDLCNHLDYTGTSLFLRNPIAIAFLKKRSRLTHTALTFSAKI